MFVDAQLIQTAVSRLKLEVDLWSLGRNDIDDQGY